uniref:Uncharacterized protein n=1 Tax=Meloidogyne floridensis TaxID=298350 RepID=A0A915NHV2_9BILA
MPSDLVNRSIKSELISESLNAPLISQPNNAKGKVKTPIIKREIREEIPEQKRRTEKRKLHHTEEGYPDVPVKKRKLRIINNWAQKRPSKTNIQRKIWAHRKQHTLTKQKEGEKGSIEKHIITGSGGISSFDKKVIHWIACTQASFSDINNPTTHALFMSNNPLQKLNDESVY